MADFSWLEVYEPEYLALEAKLREAKTDVERMAVLDVATERLPVHLVRALRMSLDHLEMQG